MKEQKVVITDKEKEINDMIDRGWTIVSVCAQHVATSVSTANSFGKESIVVGKFCFLLEREK